MWLIVVAIAHCFVVVRLAQKLSNKSITIKIEFFFLGSQCFFNQKTDKPNGLEKNEQMSANLFHK